MIPGTDACCILLYGDIGEYDDNVRSVILPVNFWKRKP